MLSSSKKMTTPRKRQQQPVGLVALFALLLLLLPSPSRSTSAGPYANGTYATGELDVGTRADPAGALAPWHVKVWYPIEKHENHENHEKHMPSLTMPVLLFVSGFGGEYAISSYSSVLSEMSAHGMVVVGVDRKFKLSASVNYTELAESLDGVLAFIASGADTGLASRLAPVLPPGARLNTSAILLGGHSAGNHVAIRRLVSFGCGPVAGVLMIDPVDGEDPYGFVKIFVIHPPAPVNFVVPALHIETGLDPIKASLLTPPCAPSNMSNERFFNAWRGPIYQMNATNMGHMDLANLKGGGLERLVCASKKNETAMRLYQQTIAAASFAFANGLVVDNNMVSSGADAVLSGKTGTAAPVSVLYKQKFTMPPQDIRAGCKAFSGGERALTVE